VPPSGALNPRACRRASTTAPRSQGRRCTPSPAPGTDTAKPRHPDQLPRRPGHRHPRRGLSKGRAAAITTGNLYGLLPGRRRQLRPETSRSTRGERGRRTRSSSAGRAHNGRASFSFRVATPYPTTGIKGLPPTPRRRHPRIRASLRHPGLHPPDPGCDRPRTVNPKGGQSDDDHRPRPGTVRAAHLQPPQGRLVWFDQLPGGRGTRLKPERAALPGAQDDLTWVAGPGPCSRSASARAKSIVMDRKLPEGPRRSAPETATRAESPRLPASPPTRSPTSPSTTSCDCDLDPGRGRAGNGVIVDTAVQAVDVKTGSRPLGVAQP